MKVPWESWSIVYIVLHIYFVSRYISVSSGKDGDHEGERDDLELDDDEGSLQARLHPGLGLAHRAAARHPRLEQRLQRHHHRQEPRTLHAGLSFSRWERSVGLIMLLRFSRGWISVINIRWLPTTMANALFIKHRQKCQKCWNFSYFSSICHIDIHIVVGLYGYTPVQKLPSWGHK